MTKILTTLFVTAFLLLPLGTLYAQGENINIDFDDVEIQILEQDTEEMENEEEEQEEDDETEQEGRSLAETLEEEEIEQIQPERRSFWTILAAILIPSIFIILCYFMLKFFQS